MDNGFLLTYSECNEACSVLLSRSKTQSQTTSKEFDSSPVAFTSASAHLPLPQKSLYIDPEQASLYEETQSAQKANEETHVYDKLEDYVSNNSRSDYLTFS
jgi:hypothetical protein